MNDKDPKVSKDSKDSKDFRVFKVLAPFIDTVRVFFSKKGVLPALLFMLLFRFPEAQLAKMAQPSEALKYSPSSPRKNV